MVNLTSEVDSFRMDIVNITSAVDSFRAEMVNLSSENSKYLTSY
jgi:hypothetical protein